MYYRYRGRTLVVSRICSFFSNLKNRKIKIDIDDLSKYKTKITQYVKEKYVSDMIHNYKLQMDNIPFYVLRDLCETLSLYDIFEQYYQLSERIDEDFIKKLNRRLNQATYIPKKLRAQVANDQLELLKLMEIQGNEVDPREHLTLVRALIMKFFLKDSTLKENLFKMQYVYIEKGDYYKKCKIYSKKNLKNNCHYQLFIDQLLKFYFHNKLYYETRSNILPIIGYKNNIPIFDPKLMSLNKYMYSLSVLKLTNISYMSLFD